MINLLTSLNVEHFRGIKSAEIPNLRKINIFIGKNNSGKSTIFDLLAFFKAPFNFFNTFNEPVIEALLQRRVNRQTLAEIEFFYNYQDNDIKSVLKFENKAISLSASLKNDFIKYSWFIYLENNNVSRLTQNSFPKYKQEIATFVLNSHEFRHYTNFLNHSGQQQSIEDTIDNFHNDITRITRDFGSELANYLNSDEIKKNLMFLSNVILIDADFVRKIEKIENTYWANILKRRGDKTLTKVLNDTFGLDIEGFTFAPYQRDSSKIFTLLKQISMHIDDYGDGFRYAFSILSVASQAKNTVLLIEEPEVHQHEGALIPIFKALYELALANNLQIFISTHSPQVIEIWTKITKDLSIFHLSKDKEDVVTARLIDGMDAELLVDLGANPIRLDETTQYMVVEGCEDSTFFSILLEKLGQKRVRELGYEIMECSKDAQQTTVSALVSTGKNVVVYADYDKKNNSAEFIKPYFETLKSKYGEIDTIEKTLIVKKTGSTVNFIPMGLPDDTFISGLGITHFAMEDFLVKLLEMDSSVKEWAGISVTALKDKSQALKDKADLKSSKTLLMTLGVIKTLTLPEIIKEIINKSNKESLNLTLESVLKPLVKQ